MTPLSITLGSVLSLVALAELGLFIFFLRYEKTIATKAFSGVIFGTFIWVGGNAAEILFSQNPLTFDKLTYLGATLLTASFLVFIHAFPFPKTNIVQSLKFFPIVACIFFGYLLFFTDTFVKQFSVSAKGMSTINASGISLTVWSIFFIAVWGLAIIELVRRYQENIGETKRRIRYLLIGVGISLIVGLIFDVIIPLFYRSTFLFIAPAISIIWMLFLIKGIRLNRSKT